MKSLDGHQQFGSEREEKVSEIWRQSNRNNQIWKGEETNTGKIMGGALVTYWAISNSPISVIRDSYKGEWVRIYTWIMAETFPKISVCVSFESPKFTDSKGSKSKQDNKYKGNLPKHIKIKLLKTN